MMRNLAEISEDVRDAILEIFNVGVGRAASVMSSLGNCDVSLSVPELAIIPRADLMPLIENACSGAVSGIRQGFFGPFAGDSLLIFPERRSLELARSLVPEPDQAEDMTEMEREALLEVGNIVLNACLSSLADLLHVEIDSDVPAFFSGQPTDLTDRMIGFGDCDLLFLRIDFRLGSGAIDGYVVFVLDLRAADALRQAVESILQAMATR